MTRRWPHVVPRFDSAWWDEPIDLGPVPEDPDDVFDGRAELAGRDDVEWYDDCEHAWDRPRRRMPDL